MQATEQGVREPGKYRYQTIPRTLIFVTSHHPATGAQEVLLIRGTFEFPPLKDDHRYRIVVGGSAHVNSGEGFALFLNGKLIAESTRGVAVRQGGQPRGAHIFADLRPEIEDGGKVTIAATSFLRYNHPRFGVRPPRGHISVWLEEMKIPPAAISARTSH